MGGSFGSVLLGRELEWHRVGNPPGTWAYSLHQQTIAEFWWSPEDREVRAEAGSAVWRIPFRGVFLLRGTVIETDAAVPRLVFAGGPRRGLMETPNGPRFILFSQMDKGVGPWVGIDDDRGNGILRIRGRIGRGSIWSAVNVTPDRKFAGVLEPLLILWGGISVLRQKIPWLGVTTLAASEKAIQREDESLIAGAKEVVAMILKPDVTGAMKLWRGGFAPPSMWWECGTQGVEAGNSG